MVLTEEPSAPKKQMNLTELLAKKGATLQTDSDLVGEIWEDRPALSCEPVMELDVNGQANPVLTNVQESVNQWKRKVQMDLY